MFKPRHLAFAKQISMITAGLVLITLVLVVTFAAWYSNQNARQQAQSNLQQQVKSTADQLSIAYDLAKTSTDRLATLFNETFSKGLDVSDTSTVVVGTQISPQASYQGVVLNNNFSAVDEFTHATGGVATIFVKSGDDFIRISTSLKKEDGSRAIGTKLDHQHPAYASMFQGQAYTGRATLFGRQYMTKYSPVKDSKGEVNGILFVGFDLTDTLAALNKSILSNHFGQTGQGFVVQTQGKDKGKLMVHRTLAGKNLSDLGKDNPGLSELIAPVLAGGEGLVQFDWGIAGEPQGRQLMAYISSDTWGGITVVGGTSEQELFAATRNMTLIMVGVGAVSTALLLALLYSTTTSRIKPMRQLTEMVLRLGNGDLKVRASFTGINEGQSRNEIILLGRGFNRMAEQMGQLIDAVRHGAQEVSHSSEELSTAAEQLTDGARNESHAAAGMASAVEQMTSSISSVGASAEQALAVSHRANDLARSGYQSIESATAQMNQIAGSVESTAHVIEQLGEQSRQISAIAAIIKGIAEQTNLLALNAAIEAARAGEQGRGFSVVAVEVRRLAERTRESTEEIGGMIGAIQKSAGVAVGDMETAVKLVQRGVELVHVAGQAMNDINAEAGHVATAVEAINVALREQNSASNSIARQVERVAEMSEENHATAANSAEAARHMESVSEELLTAIRRFA